MVFHPHFILFTIKDRKRPIKDTIFIHVSPRVDVQLRFVWKPDCFSVSSPATFNNTLSKSYNSSPTGYIHIYM